MAAAAVPSMSGEPNGHPQNLLVMMSDEHQARAMGCAGHDVVQTPNLDALASAGARFTNCWTPSPICVPARASFATGRWVHRIGAWDSVQAYRGDPAGWPHALRDAGYEVVSFGKLHHRSAADDDGFVDRVLPMFIAGGVGWLQGLPRRDPLPYPEAAELAADVGTGHTSYTRYDERVTAAAVDWIGSRPAERPWAAFVSLVAPHFPLSAPAEFTALYPLAEIPPARVPAQPVTHPAVDAMRRFFDYGAHFDDVTERRGRRAYFALCSWLDHNVGRVIDALDRSGQRERTRIVYTSDHGEMLGERGLWAKSFMYEDSVRIPMICAGPGLEPGTVVDANVNLVDVAATASDLVAATVGDGRSLWSTVAEPDAHRPAFSEYHDGGSITGSFAIGHGRWKYVEHIGHAPQLFDLAGDPLELVDLGQSPAHAAARDECADVLRSIVDPEAADRAAFSSQERLLARYGGRDGVARGFRFNHTPAPADQLRRQTSG